MSLNMSSSPPPVLHDVLYEHWTNEWDIVHKTASFQCLSLGSQDTINQLINKTGVWKLNPQSANHFQHMSQCLVDADLMNQQGFQEQTLE